MRGGVGPGLGPPHWGVAGGRPQIIAGNWPDLANPQVAGRSDAKFGFGPFGHTDNPRFPTGHPPALSAPLRRNEAVGEMCIKCGEGEEGSEEMPKCRKMINLEMEMKDLQFVMILVFHQILHNFLVDIHNYT